VAEWLRSGLQNRLPRFNSGRGLHTVGTAYDPHLSDLPSSARIGAQAEKADFALPLTSLAQDFRNNAADRGGPVLLERAQIDSAGMLARRTNEVQPWATGGHGRGDGRIHPQIRARRPASVPNADGLLCSFGRQFMIVMAIFAHWPSPFAP
jgi:hypothetical protein